MSVRSVVAMVMLGAALPGTAPIQAQQTPAANPLDVVPDKMPFDIPYGTPISLERAEAAIAATVAEAKKHDWKLNVAVVDSGGNLVAFQLAPPPVRIIDAAKQRLVPGAILKQVL